MRAQKRRGRGRLGRPRTLSTDIVERVVRERHGGATLAAIADGLTAAGVPTAMGGARWYASTVRAVLDSAALEAAHAASKGRLGPQGGPYAAAPGVGDIPARENTFVGRERELRRLRARLGRSRVLTLTGVPGVGKSRLAVELASGLPRPDGVVWVDLTRATNPELVPRSVAHALSVREQPGQSIGETILFSLATREVLLVFDNCDHVLPAAADLASAIARDCPGVTVLATSQAPLRVAGEEVASIRPLALPDATTTDMATVLASDAVRLFCERAVQTRHGFRMDADTVPAVLEICRRLDGLPLAIELAAAWVGVLNPAGIAERLENRFALLTRGTGGAGGRHRTLREALEWSHELLPPSQKVLLRRLSVFVGGCTLPAVEAVCTEPEDDAAAVLDPLSALVSKSLVVADISSSTVRYRLLETIRLYAGEQLAGAGERDALEARHALWCVGLAEQAGPAVAEAGQVGSLECLESEQDNLRAAIASATKSGDRDVALRLTGALALFWRVRGQFREGRDWLAAALAIPGPDDASTRAAALWGLGFLELMLNHHGQAMAALEEALVLSRRLRDARGQARALLLLGNAHGFADWSRAPALLEESAALARREGDAWCLGHALAMQGWIQIGYGTVTAARAPLDECVRVAREAGELQSLHIGLYLLGEAALNSADYADSESALREALQVARLLGEPFDVAAALILLGELATARGDEHEAQAHFQAALACAGPTGNASATAGALRGLGAVALAKHDTAQARRMYTEAAAISGGPGMLRRIALKGLADVAAVEGDVNAARDQLEEVLSLCAAANDQPLIAETLASLAGVNGRDGKDALAAKQQRDALRIRHRLGDVRGTEQSLEVLGELGVRGGRVEQGVRLLAAARAVRERKRIPRSPSREQELVAAAAAARAVLGAAAFEAAWAEGHAMPLDDAVALAAQDTGTRDRPKAGWSGLTPSEHRVAALVAEGLTNAQVATRLSVSRSTVEGHVSHIFGKLGLESRSQLVREMLRRDTPHLPPPAPHT